MHTLWLVVSAKDREAAFFSIPSPEDDDFDNFEADLDERQYDRDSTAQLLEVISGQISAASEQKLKAHQEDASKLSAVATKGS